MAAREICPGAPAGLGCLDLGWPGRLLGYILFFAMAAFPMVLQLLYLKGALFAVVVILFSMRVLYTGNTGLHPQVLQWSIAMALAGALFTLWGAVNGASTTAALHSAEIYVMWPLIYLALVGASCNWRVLAQLPLVATVSALFIGVYGLAYAMAQLGVVPNLSPLGWVSLSSQQAIGTYTGYTRLMSVGLNSLPFLFPLITMLLAVRALGIQVRVPRLLLWGALAADLAVIIISGRRALLIIAMVSIPVSVVVATMSARARLRPLWVAVVALASTFLFLGVGYFILYLYPQFTVSGAWGYFARGFSLTPSSPDLSGALRGEEFIVLLRGFEQSPVLGHGLGTAAPLIRSAAMPWSYELSYMALLFHVGLVGVLAYLLAVLWILRSGIRFIRARPDAAWMVSSVLAGLTGMLIANATNPYLARFDGLWTLFWPVALINYLLLGGRGESRIPDTGKGMARGPLGVSTLGPAWR